ncbi:hypothetical protein H0H87_004647, partial [Tephrocybe sp. NHM501043]
SYSAGSYVSHELLLDIKHFLEGHGPLKELDVEELFSSLNQICLLETLHLNIAFQTTQALLLYHEHLYQFINHDVTHGTQLSALHFSDPDLSQASETAANDSDVEVTEAFPKDNDISSAIAATLKAD